MTMYKMDTRKKQGRGMKKRFKLIFIVLALGILLFGRGLLVRNVYIDVLDEGEKVYDIEQIIKKAIRIQYGWGNIDELNQLCTEEFLNNVDIDEIYLGRKVYTIEKGYMDMVREVSGNELEVTVSVYSPDIRFHDFTLTRDEEGKYLINKIEHDM